MQIMGPLLAGNARTFLLAAISPLAEDYLETISTLRLAVRAQKIQVCLFDHVYQGLEYAHTLQMSCDFRYCAMLCAAYTGFAYLWS